jgi:hypothetical protein
VPNIGTATSSPATSVVTTAETLAANIPATPLALPGGSPQQVIIRGGVVITTGASVTQVSVKLRVGQNNTTTAQVGNTETEVAAAAATLYVPFEFVDLVPGDLVNSGYSITVSQVAATGNGTIVQVVYEIDYTIP